ncbi:aminoglycoside 6-adenylyltransferase [Lacticaseibacillus kribbianus]|uniref:aminoglycoside 6-adenylyltransferase n=1 Tax=Lacticaseibacillus kribbianus TaxID=2926292 RepID=UPI001CD3442F|nr:aminoglycoside 6-adenylyltransferase [Lacticaseibacillus kribbianus]
MTDLDRIIALAEADANVVAIGTEGSSNNPDFHADPWVDLDVSIFVTDPAQADGNWWIHQLGEPTLVQHLANEALFGAASHIWDTYLTRYSGARRVDLKIAPAEDIAVYLADDKLNALVWKREAGRLQKASTDASSHWVAVPDQVALNACANEFYWCLGNVVKGVARGNLMYANEMFNRNARPMLIDMLAYRETAKDHGRFDAGVCGKYTWDRLTEAERTALAATYQQGDLGAIAASIQAALTLFSAVYAQVQQLTGLAPMPYLDSAKAQFDQWLAALA